MGGIDRWERKGKGRGWRDERERGVVRGSHAHTHAHIRVMKKKVFIRKNNIKRIIKNHSKPLRRMGGC